MKIVSVIGWKWLLIIICKILIHFYLFHHAYRKFKLSAIYSCLLLFFFVFIARNLESQSQFVHLLDGFTTL